MAVLKKDQSNTDALLIRAKSFFMLGELDAAVTHLKQCIRIQPDHQQCGDEAKRMLTIQSKRDSANQLFKANRFWESGLYF